MNLDIQWGTAIYSLIIFFIVLAVIIGIPCMLIVLFLKRRKDLASDVIELEQRVRKMEEELRRK